MFVWTLTAPLSAEYVTVTLPSFVPPSVSNCGSTASPSDVPVPPWPPAPPAPPPVGEPPEASPSEGDGSGDGSSVGHVSDGTQANLTSYALPAGATAASVSDVVGRPLAASPAVWRATPIRAGS